MRPTPLILTFKRFLSVFLRFLKITVTPVITARNPGRIRVGRVTAAATGGVTPCHPGWSDRVTVRKTSEGREREHHTVREGGWMIHKRFFPVRFR